MLFKAWISQSAAILAGRNRSGGVEIDIDPAKLSQEERELLASEYSEYASAVGVTDVTAAALLQALRQKRADRVREEEKSAQEREAKVAAALVAPLEQIVRVERDRSTDPPIEVWRLPELSNSRYDQYPIDPRLVERWATLQAQVDAHNAAALAEVEVAKRILGPEISRLRQQVDDLKAEVAQLNNEIESLQGDDSDLE